MPYWIFHFFRYISFWKNFISFRFDPFRFYFVSHFTGTQGEVIATNILWVVITIWLTVTKYPDLKRQWILFYILHRCFVSSITAKTFTRLYMRSNSVGILYEAGTTYHSRAP
jgi:hypothetical protein